MQPEQAAGGARDGLAADDDRGGVAQELGPEALAESDRRAALEDLWQLPWRQVQQRDHDRDPGEQRRGPCNGVVDGPRGTAPLDRGGSQQAGRRQ